MEESKEKVRKIQYNFVNFLWERLAAIERDLDEGRPFPAWKKTYRLLKYMPSAVKKELSEMAEKYNKIVNQYNTKVSKMMMSPYEKLRTRRHVVDRFAWTFTNDFIDKMMLLLDEREYLEIRARRVPTGYERAGYE